MFGSGTVAATATWALQVAVVPYARFGMAAEDVHVQASPVVANVVVNLLGGIELEEKAPWSTARGAPGRELAAIEATLAWIGEVVHGHGLVALIAVCCRVWQSCGH